MTMPREVSNAGSFSVGERCRARDGDVVIISGRAVYTADISLPGMVHGCPPSSTWSRRSPRAFWDHHAFQCGFCVSGMLFATEELLAREPAPHEAQIRGAIDANLCRCTGYQNIVAAIRAVADRERT